MKILHTADWHIGQFKGPVVDGVNLRSQDTVKCLEYMVQVAIEEKPDIVCVSGDIFHQEQVGPVRYSDEMITATNIITSLAHFSKYLLKRKRPTGLSEAIRFVEYLVRNIKLNQSGEISTMPIRRLLKRLLRNMAGAIATTDIGYIQEQY